MMVRAGVHSFMGIGPVLKEQQDMLKSFIEETLFFRSTEELLEKIKETQLSDRFQNAIVLVKGARVFQFEKIVQQLQKKIHGTVMEVDLGAMVHNLNFFRSRLKSGVKLMAMVKAFAYGSGNTEGINFVILK